MKISKYGSAEFVDLDLDDMLRLELMDLVACGAHGTHERGEDDGVWDLSCMKCALRFDTALALASRIASRLRTHRLEIPEKQ
jgi:hypothetical protein